jgi:hypothetical protein
MSAFAALVETFVGRITSIATSWIGQQCQTKESPVPAVHSRRVEINAFSDACHEELKMY